MRVFFWALTALACVTTGCIKSSADSVVKADGSATIRFQCALRTSTFESMKKAPLDCTCWRIYQIHKDSIPTVRQALDTFESTFDGNKVSDAWSKLGLKVSKASTTESDGWKILDVEATVGNVAEFHQKFASAMKDAGKDEYITKIPWYLHTRKLLPKLPRFYKTEDPTIVKAIIPVADVGSEIADLSELSEEEAKKLRTQLGYMRTMKAFDDGELKVRVKLPGTIVSVENAQKEGDDVVVLDLKGPAVEPKTISDQAKVGGVITAKIKIDPETFKIPLETE